MEQKDFKILWEVKKKKQTSMKLSLTNSAYERERGGGERREYSNISPKLT